MYLNTRTKRFCLEHGWFGEDLRIMFTELFRDSSRYFAIATVYMCRLVQQLTWYSFICYKRSVDHKQNFAVIVNISNVNLVIQCSQKLEIRNLLILDQSG